MNYMELLDREIAKDNEFKLDTYPYEYSGDLNTFQIYDFDRESLTEVVQRSQSAFEQFRHTSSYVRTEILLKAAGLLENHSETMAEIISLEAKKPIKAARQEVGRCVQTLKLSGIEASKLEGESINLDVAPNGSNREAFTKYEPLGIVYAMTPFNFPLNLALHKIGPAIAVGNSVIIKPSEKTPFSSFFMRHIFEESGLPEDVLQIVTGDGERVTDHLLEFDEIKKLSFTGSARVGKIIKSKVGLRELTLELGSTSPVYITKDINDLEGVAQKVVNGAFSYNGQVCISTQKAYVDEEIYDAFISHLKTQTEALKYGDVLDEATDFSDLIDEQSQERIVAWLEEAVRDGAEIITGGEKINGSVTPAIVANTSDDMKICTNEIFGPVLVVEKAASSMDMSEKLNASEFGLNVGVFTNDLKRALKLGNALDYGQVLINDVPTLRFDHMPYNGRKNSGYGTEGIKYAIREMAKLKMISLNYE